MNTNEIIVGDNTLNILFTFDYNNEQYVVYYDEEDEISASKFDGVNLIEITKEEEWDIVDKEIEERMN